MAKTSLHTDTAVARLFGISWVPYSYLQRGRWVILWRALRVRA